MPPSDIRGPKRGPGTERPLGLSQEGVLRRRRVLMGICGLVVAVLVGVGVVVQSHIHRERRIRAFINAIDPSLQPCRSIAKADLPVEFVVACKGGGVTFYKVSATSDLARLTQHFSEVRADCPWVGYGRWGITNTISGGLVSCGESKWLFWCDAYRNVVGNVTARSPSAILRRWEAALGASGISHEANPTDVPSQTIYHDTFPSDDTSSTCPESGS